MPSDRQLESRVIIDAMPKIRWAAARGGKKAKDWINEEAPDRIARRHIAVEGIKELKRGRTPFRHLKETP